jgi:DNA-binding MarR family transcriptional regulator
VTSRASRDEAAEPLIRIPPTFETEFPGSSHRAVETFLNIGVLTGAVRSTIASFIASFGLPSDAAFNVLIVVAGAAEPIRPSVIASRMMVTRATITGVLDSLESRGLVRRVASANDGRARDVSITTSGKRLARRIEPKLHEFETALMTVLTDGELDELLRMVAVLQSRLPEVAL